MILSRISFGWNPSSDPAGIRTQDPNIKSVMLYRLSYGIVFWIELTLGADLILFRMSGLNM